MGIHAIMIINKAGGLIYNKDFGTGITKLTTNEYLVLAGTFHGIHAITQQLSPVKSSQGLNLLQSADLSIYCFQSATSLKFVLITSPDFTLHQQACQKLYEFYGDYAMKNPFYQPEMPIRAELFDLQVKKYIAGIHT